MREASRCTSPEADLEAGAIYFFTWGRCMGAPIRPRERLLCKEGRVRRYRNIKEGGSASNKIFRVSDRRPAQVPAVALLVSVLAEALPQGIKITYFSQEGGRERILFREALEDNIKDIDKVVKRRKKMDRWKRGMGNKC